LVRVGHILIAAFFFFLKSGVPFTVHAILAGASTTTISTTTTDDDDYDIFGTGTSK